MTTHTPFALATVLLAASLNAHAADLQVTLHGVQSDAGEVLLALYNEEKLFLRTSLKAVKTGASGRNADQQVRLVFRDLPPGRYALSGFHDLNGNGELDSNAMRMPTEPVGFSNGAQPRFGPPKFNAAAITVEATDLHIDITLR